MTKVQGGLTMPKKTKQEAERIEATEELKDMVSSLNELPTDVLEQLLKNLEDIEAYNKAHPEEFKKGK